MLVILGEAHTNKSSIDGIEKYIRANKPEILLHELCFNAELTVEQVKKELANCSGKGICDPRTNMDIFKLCSDLNIGLIGLDLGEEEYTTQLKGKSLSEGFIIREKRMLHVLKKYQHRNVIAVVGDAHIREQRTPLVDNSPITVAVKNGSLVAEIIRVDKKYREFK